jgi:prepilin-type N-terminal cleavage/methylation domain-containing protein
MDKPESNRDFYSEKGFTLIETMVAVTLVALMAVGMWSVFRTGIVSWSRGTQYIDEGQRERILNDMVRKQMASAFPLAAPVDPAIQNVTYPLFKGTEKSMEFVSLNSLRFQDSPGLTLVQYELSQEGEGSGYKLVEREKPYLGQASDSGEDTGVFSLVPIFDNISNCYFEYKNPAPDEYEEPWVREWDAEQERRLPSAISMTFEVTDAKGQMQGQQIIVPIQANEEYVQSSSRGSSGRGRGRGRGGISRVVGDLAPEQLSREFLFRDEQNPQTPPGMGRGPGGPGGRGGRGGRGGPGGPGGPGMGPGFGGPGMGPGGNPQMPPGGGQGFGGGSGSRRNGGQ